MEQCNLERNVLTYFGIVTQVDEKTEIKTDFGQLVNLLCFHEQEILRKVNPVKFVDPKKEYPVHYTINQSGERIFKNQMLIGADLTEPQVHELFLDGRL